MYERYLSAAIEIDVLLLTQQTPSLSSSEIKSRELSLVGVPRTNTTVEESRSKPLSSSIE